MFQNNFSGATEDTMNMNNLNMNMLGGAFPANNNNNESGIGNTEAERLELLKRQLEVTAGNNDGSNSFNRLGMNLQAEYDLQETEQQLSNKRHRGNADFGLSQLPMNNGRNDINGSDDNKDHEGQANALSGNSNSNSMNTAAGAPNSDGSAANNNGNNMNLFIPNNLMNMNMNGMNMNNMMAAMNPAMAMNMANMNMANMNAMMGAAGMNMNMMGAAGMNMGMMGGGMNMNMNPAGMGGMNAAMAARAGMLGAGMGGAAASADSSGDASSPAASMYMNDPASRMGLLGGFGAGATAGNNPFGDFSRLVAAQNAFGAGLGSPGFPGAAGGDVRRAQLMALMDMENAERQGEGAAGSSNAGADGIAGSLNDEWGAAAVAQANRAGSNKKNQGEAEPLQIPAPPMDIPTFSTTTTPASLPLPPVIEEGASAHFSQRTHIPLGIDEDNNWLTEFQCFIRFDLIEVVQTSRHVDQGGGKGKSAAKDGESFQQVGVRCRYCAHLHPGQRASRSSAFPSSIRQLYQSFTMMLRDHFEQCSQIPPLRKKLFTELKSKNSQGAYDSKQYWIYAAQKLGMVDSDHGIQMTAETQAIARRKAPFGSSNNVPVPSGQPVLLVSPQDRGMASDYLFTLMSQVQVVHLIESERVGKRKTLRVGLPGFGCRYCCHVGRCGLSRMFPLRRRMLPGKINEIHEHFQRCTLFPTKEKELLARLKADVNWSPDQEKELFDRIWERLGAESEVK